uniref:Uncharacterized protein n=1 Tax=Lotharella oceanica TaxID=641309 RepID=A0A7S2TN92_9EUKA|mmetsp:Transcript_20292/g.38179  ORF Transcript_20292/g.38179 Transcript_20292/m.38179 type:complete len:159 (+) Transcript_20292:326-802(+)
MDVFEDSKLRATAASAGNDRPESLGPPSEKREKNLSKDEEIELLRKENAELRAKLKRFNALDVLVVWNGEDGGPKVRVVAPSDLRDESLRALDFIWDHKYPRDSEYNHAHRTKAYAPGERRPMASLYRVKPQLTSAEVDAGEPDFDRDSFRFKAPSRH